MFVDDNYDYQNGSRTLLSTKVAVFFGIPMNFLVFFTAAMKKVVI